MMDNEELRVFQHLKLISDRGPSGLCVLKRNENSVQCVFANMQFFEMHGIPHGTVEESSAELINILPYELLFRNSSFEQSPSNSITYVYMVYGIDKLPHWMCTEFGTYQAETGTEYIFLVASDINDNIDSDNAVHLPVTGIDMLSEPGEKSFDIDVPRNVAEFTSLDEEGKVIKRIIGNYSDKFRNNEYVHADDFEMYVNTISKALRTPGRGAIEYRANYEAEDYIWNRCSYMSIADGTGDVVRLVGRITIIESEKQYQKMAEKDTLTGIYNRGTFQFKAEEYISTCGVDECFGLLIIDLDDFKRVNDTFGHAGGDNLLISIAKTLSSTFRVSDIVSRIGGDEFAVLMKNNRGRESAEMKAQKILDECAKIMGNFGIPHLSCSIGITIGQGRVANFMTLFNEADKALYEAKNQGKCRYVVYDRDICGNAEESRNDTVLQRTEIATPVTEATEEGITEEYVTKYVLGELLDSSDVIATINSIIRNVGERTAMSRIFILEEDASGKNLNGTFEWCARGIPSAAVYAEKLPLKKEDHLSHYNDGVVYYCPDVELTEGKEREVLKSRGVRSTLQFALFDGERIIGCMGFEDCMTARMWKKDQTDAMRLMTKVISTFLYKERLKKTGGLKSGFRFWS
ncbi:MAG: sensor domain-containing diguanylate cyclase [Clostridia bacterium]|nr:sensor domain-containing diguanylate cyclase [Clostridia bacterium]